MELNLHGAPAKHLLTLEGQWRDYQTNFEFTRFSRYMDYPRHVHMETMAICNAACNFCPYPKLDRKGEKMADHLIEKIIHDLTDMPKDLSFQISPFKVNEPFLDVRIFDVLGLINEKLPQARISLTTNASALTPNKISKLHAVKHVTYLWISFNDHVKERYEQVMQLPYERTIERLNYLHACAARKELGFRVLLSRVDAGNEDDAAFTAWCNEHFPLFMVEHFRRADWLGQSDAVPFDVPDVGCERWFEISITATGKVAHCCMDGQAKWSIGNVNTHHVLDIYNAPEYRSLRETKITRKGIEPCQKCSFV